MLAQRAAEQAAQRRRERMIRVGAAVAVVLVVLGVVLFMATRGATRRPTMPRCPRRVDTAGGGCPSVRPKHRSSSCTRTSSARSARRSRTRWAARWPTWSQPAPRASCTTRCRSSTGSSAMTARCAPPTPQGAPRTPVPSPRTTTPSSRTSPQREGDGYTDEELLQFGRDAGIEGDAYATFETCVQDRTYEGWVQQVQQDGQRPAGDGHPDAVPRR